MTAVDAGRRSLGIHREDDKRYASTLCPLPTYSERLNEDSSLKNTSKGQAAKKMKLFAVKANFNKLLDVARETYRENQADITAREQVLSRRG